MDKNEIRAIVSAEKRAAIGSSTTSDLTRQRSDALDYYMGDLKEHMPTLEGQSKATSSDVSDTIEAMLPPLMDIFTSGEDYVEFAPVGPEDEEQAKQETDYVNHIFMNENPGFLVLYSMIKDALLSKNGIVKAWWEEYEEVEKETYRGLDADSYAIIAADTEAEIVQQTDLGDGTMDVVVSKKTKKGCFKCAVVPPEEFGISAQAKTIPESGYCFHRYRKSQSELITDGYDKATVEGLPTSSSRNGDEYEEGRSRDTFDDESDPQSVVNRSMRLIDVTEHYIKLDVDEDGVAELLKVVTAGPSDTLLGEPEEFDRMPFHSITPYPMTHRFFGRSVADLTIDIMRIKTHLLRQLLDNASLLNNQRIAIGQIGADENTLDDLLTNRPGGIVRMKDVSQLREIPNQQLGPHILPLIEYVDQSRETRTGITRNVGGIDPDVLNKAASTATGFQGLLDASMMRIKLIARIFSETGIKDLFLHIHELTRKHQDKEKVVKLRNQWIEVDPRGWRTRNDMTVNIALGTGSKQQQLMLLNALLERQKEAIQFQGGADGPLVNQGNVYNTLKQMTELAGFKNVDRFFTEPDPDAPPKETPPDPKLLEAQAKAQQAEQSLMMQKEINDAKLEMEREKSNMKLGIERDRAALQQQLAEQKARAEYQLSLEKMQMEGDLAERKMAIEAELAAYRAELNAETSAYKADSLSTNRPGGDLSV
jgi:hypothetical protein